MEIVMLTVDLSQLPEIATPEEVALFFQMKPSQINRLANNGAMAFIKGGRGIKRFTKSHIQQYILEQEQCQKQITGSLKNLETKQGNGKLSGSKKEGENAKALALAILNKQINSSQSTSPQSRHKNNVTRLQHQPSVF